MPAPTKQDGEIMMNQTLRLIPPYPSCLKKLEVIPLFSGIELSYLSFAGESFSVRPQKASYGMVIHYCKSGRIGWKMENGKDRYLGPGDFSVHTLKFCANSEVSLPNGNYEGLSISVDLQKLTDTPPEFLLGTGITGISLYEKLFKHTPLISFTGNERTDAIFQFFFDQPENTKSAYQKIKVLELLLYLSQTPPLSHPHGTKYQTEQIEVIRQIHEQLLTNLDRRITIEELSKQYLMNPTTMKTLFKSVYGASIAAHMKEHRMRKAAQLLLESELSIAEIAFAVGYDSQSKFSTAFKEFFQMLPKEYKKKRPLHQERG